MNYLVEGVLGSICHHGLRPPTMRTTAYDMALPMLAIAAALAVFGALVSLAGVNPLPLWVLLFKGAFGGLVSMVGVTPLQVWVLLFKGAFGDAFSWQNTLQRAAPLMLTALCVALPARAGLVIIGAEGALVLGGLACAAAACYLPLPGNAVGTAAACAAGALAGGLWLEIAGWLRQYRGINETISSLLLAYIAIGLF